MSAAASSAATAAAAAGPSTSNDDRAVHSIVAAHRSSALAMFQTDAPASRMMLLRRRHLAAMNAAAAASSAASAARPRDASPHQELLATAEEEAMALFQLATSHRDEALAMFRADAPASRMVLLRRKGLAAMQSAASSPSSGPTDGQSELASLLQEALARAEEEAMELYQKELEGGGEEAKVELGQDEDVDFGGGEAAGGIPVEEGKEGKDTTRQPSPRTVMDETLGHGSSTKESNDGQSMAKEQHAANSDKAMAADDAIVGAVGAGSLPRAVPAEAPPKDVPSRATRSRAKAGAASSESGEERASRSGTSSNEATAAALGAKSGGEKPDSDVQMLDGNSSKRKSAEDDGALAQVEGRRSDKRHRASSDTDGGTVAGSVCRSRNFAGKRRWASNFTGAGYNKGNGMYEACVNHETKRIYLGQYAMAADAALAHDEAVRLVYGNEKPEEINFASSKEHRDAREKEARGSGRSVDLDETLAKIASKVKGVVASKLGHKLKVSITEEAVAEMESGAESIVLDIGNDIAAPEAEALALASTDRDTSNEETAFDVSTLKGVTRYGKGYRGNIQVAGERYGLPKFTLACDAALMYDEAYLLFKGKAVNFGPGRDYKKTRGKEMKARGVHIDQGDTMKRIALKLEDLRKKKASAEDGVKDDDAGKKFDSSLFKGITRVSSKYRAQISDSKLGTFVLASDAALIYDEASRLLKGYAVNFGPDLIFLDHKTTRAKEMKSRGVSVDLDDTMERISSKMKELREKIDRSEVDDKAKAAGALDLAATSDDAMPALPLPKNQRFLSHALFGQSSVPFVDEGTADGVPTHAIVPVKGMRVAVNRYEEGTFEGEITAVRFDREQDIHKIRVAFDNGDPAEELSFDEEVELLGAVGV